MSAINTAIIGKFIGKNPSFLLFMNLFSIIIAILMIIIIWCSKCLVSSGSFTLNSEQNNEKDSNEKEDEFDSEFDDKFISDGSYHIRYRLASIISIN